MLGAAAAQRLGIDRVYRGERVWLGGMWFYVIGILKPAVLAPEIDESALIGYAAAKRYLNYTSTTGGKTTIGPPTTIYVRAQNNQVDAVYTVLPQTADPENPSYVDVSQPSAALTARADAQGAFNGLFLGLGAVALLVGAVGVANIMIISVLERRSEIGLRRALGATRGQIRVQFLSEAILLALLGGAVGVGVGAARDSRLRPHQALGGRDPHRGVGRRDRLSDPDRRNRRADARDPRRPPLTDRRVQDRLAHRPDAHELRRRKEEESSLTTLVAEHSARPQMFVIYSLFCQGPAHLSCAQLRAFALGLERRAPRQKQACRRTETQPNVFAFLGYTSR